MKTTLGILVSSKKLFINSCRGRGFFLAAFFIVFVFS